MIKFSPHMIRTQQVEVTFENPKDAFECKNHLATVCKSKLLPAIEKLFDQKSGQKSTICIDKLSIDAGLLNRENWEDNFVETVVSQLSKYLDTDVFKKHPYRKGAGRDVLGLPSQQSSPSVEGEGVHIHEAGNKTEVILYFLQHGILPWYAVSKDKEALHQQLGLLMTDPGFIQKVRSLIVANETVLERLIYQAREEEIYALIGGNKSRIAELKGLKKSWQRILARLNISLPKQKICFFKAAFLVLVKENEHTEIIKKITHKVVALLGKREGNIIEEVERILALKESSKNLRFSQEEVQVIQYVEELREVRKKDIKVTDKTSTESLSKKTDDPAIVEKSIVNVHDDQNPQFITNAGLVILHPFLSGLFENVGYMEDDQWISEEAHQSSLLLSQYLVTGIDEYAEFDLFLNKILMGYPLEDSLPIEIELSAFEKDETNDLLRSVINHWKALKNTSLQGLQNTFLQREGKMVKKESGWLLQVDQKPFDILLDKIPWGYSTVKTPWMEELLSVEWA